MWSFGGFFGGVCGFCYFIKGFFLIFVFEFWGNVFVWFVFGLGFFFGRLSPPWRPPSAARCCLTD